MVESLPPGYEQPAFLAIKQAWAEEKKESENKPEMKIDNRDGPAAHCTDSKPLQLSGEATQPAIGTKLGPSQQEENRESLVREPPSFLPLKWLCSTIARNVFSMWSLTIIGNTWQQQEGWCSCSYWGGRTQREQTTCGKCDCVGGNNSCSFAGWKDQTCSWTKWNGASFSGMLCSISYPRSSPFFSSGLVSCLDFLCSVLPTLDLVMRSPPQLWPTATWNWWNMRLSCRGKKRRKKSRESKKTLSFWDDVPWPLWQLNSLSWT